MVGNLDEDFLAIAIEEDIVLELLLTVCGYKLGNRTTRSCKCSSNCIPCSDLSNCCHKFCENTDPNKIPNHDSSDGEDDIDDEEQENDE